MYARKFKTIVFTKRKILKCIIYFVSGMLIAVCISIVGFKINTSTVPIQLASGNLYQAILESELPMATSHEIKSVFDLNDPKTILSYYSPLFDNVKKFPPEQTPPPIKATATPSGTESITAVGGMKISNATNYSIDLNELSEMDLPFRLDSNGPQVLIVHTHTTESFDSESAYTSGDRTTDETKNIVSVGNVIADILNQNGISTVHDTTVHDYPSYNGAYTRALTTIKQNLGQYPSVKIVLDVHRDGIVRDDGTKVKVITEIDGNTSAQVMIVAGSDASGLLHENWKENMKFASQIQKKAYQMYPTLMRPLNLREERFNTHMTKGSLIVEVGSNGNTLAEAKQAAEYIANVICKVLKN